MSLAIVPAFLGIDVESGGYAAKKHALLEFGWLFMDQDFNALEGDSVCILPQEGRTIDKTASDKNGYTPELWAERGALPLEEAAELIAGKLRGFEHLPRVAHNAPFDRQFCVAYLPRPEVLGTATALDDEGNRILSWRCSQQLLRQYGKTLGVDPKEKGFATLENGCKLAGYRRINGHGALEDCMAMAALLRFLKVQGHQLPLAA